MKSYPVEHREVTSHLLDGRFIIYPDKLFITIQKQEDEYREFFKSSFAYDLNLDSEIAYLSSGEVTEKRTRDFTLFLAVLCRELDYSSRDFREATELGTFDILETQQLLKQSSKWEILERTSIADFEKFTNTWHKKNVLKKLGSQFKFTKAIKLFFQFAVDIAQAKLHENEGM